MRDCLSVDISNWDSPGVLFGKPATECPREEVAREVWAQLKAALEATGDRVLPDELLHSHFLDPGVTGIGEGRAHNDDPLLIHPVGTWQKRLPGRASRAAASTPSTGRRSSSRSRHRTRSTTGSACRTCST